MAISAIRAKDVVYYDGTRFPFEDGMFNLVFHTEVLEHVYHLAPFLSECHRVLADDGRMLFTVPFAARNHYIPHDYWRLTPATHHAIAYRKRILPISLLLPRGGDIAVAMHKINSVFYRIIFRNIPNRILRLRQPGILYAPVRRPRGPVHPGRTSLHSSEGGLSGRPSGLHGLLQEDRFAGPDAVNRHLEP